MPYLYTKKVIYLQTKERGRCPICEFISWIEMKNGEIKFLTSDMVFKTRRGKELQKYNSVSEDWVGHGSIEWYFDLKHNEGLHKECTDFSTPDNFPKAIVTAIKAGKMKFNIYPEELLSQPAWAEYEKIEQPAWAEYEKIEQPAWAEYKKIRQSALAEYEKIEQSAWAEYKKIAQSALAEYKKIRQPAWAEYKKIRQSAFWNIFALPENRSPLWR
jgi:preprotein translocase subunit Sss1